MKLTTLDLIRAVLKADETLQPDDQERIILAITTPGQPADPRITSVNEACRRLGGVCKQTIYRFCRDGLLQPHKMPGRQRSHGVTESSLLFLINKKGTP